jgi:hypothetical protein
LALSAPSAAANAKIVDFGVYPDGIARIRRINDSYTAATATAVDIDANGVLRLYRFSTGNTIFSKMISESFFIDPQNIGAGSLQVITLTVTGASVGDFVTSRCRHRTCG